jgi:hypothetical protein
MPLTFANREDLSVGNERGVRVDITFDASYPTNGEPLTPGDLGLSRVNQLVSDQGGIGTDFGRVVQYDRDNELLLAFQGPTGAGALPEVPPATDLSDLTVRVTAYGIG